MKRQRGFFLVGANPDFAQNRPGWTGMNIAQENGYPAVESYEGKCLRLFRLHTIAFGEIFTSKDGKKLNTAEDLKGETVIVMNNLDLSKSCRGEAVR